MKHSLINKIYLIFTAITFILLPFLGLKDLFVPYVSLTLMILGDIKDKNYNFKNSFLLSIGFWIVCILYKFILK